MIPNVVRLMQWVICVGCLFLFNSVPSLSQTSVIKKSATKNDDYGVTYFLPKTSLIIRAEITENTQKAGPYAKYASKYLGINDAIMEDSRFYTLDKISVIGIGVPDKDKEYVVELKSKTIAPFLSLTEDGIICAINADYEFNADQANELSTSDESGAETTVPVETLLTEEYFRAGSVLKMSEVLSKQIYKIRESRSDIIQGEVDNAPRDGVAMKLVLDQLDAQEQALTELFRGTIHKEKIIKEYEIEPNADIEKEVLFRFSTHLGAVTSDDLSGKPVYINLKNIEPVTDAPRQQKETKGKFQGIVYNLPGKAAVEVYCGTNRMFNGELPVTQFGTIDYLSKILLEDKKSIVKVYFYPESGALKNIEQSPIR